MIRVGLNGFGRIGRWLFRLNDVIKEAFDIVAINDLDPNRENHEYLLRYDSTYGTFNCRLAGVEFHSEENIKDVPWEEEYDIDVLIDATGVRENAWMARRLTYEKMKVIITHSPVGDNLIDKTIVFGVNEDEYDPDHHWVVSSSICDAISTGPVLKFLDDEFGVIGGLITTLHPWLSYQNLMDGSLRSIENAGHYWKDFALGRSSVGNLIPKNTTLIPALSEIIPDIAVDLDAMSFRVPTSVVACADMSIRLKNPVLTTRLNDLLLKYAFANPTIMSYTKEPLVSCDFKNSPHSATIDGRWTCVNGDMARVILWYDNEVGYSNRVLDLVRKMG